MLQEGEKIHDPSTRDISRERHRFDAMHTLPEAPLAKQIPEVLELHGDQRTDPFFWLRDRENPEVIEYLNAENAYTKQLLEHTENLQEDLFREMKGRMKEDDASVPYRMRSNWYYIRYQQGQEYPLLCRKRETLENPEVVLLDQNERAQGHSYHALAGTSLSPNDQLLAVGEDTVGRRIYTVRFKDLQTGTWLQDALENTTGGVAWANDNRTVFYTVKDDSLRPHQIYRHVLGTPQSEDVLIYEESDETFVTHVHRSKSERYVIIGSSSTLSNEFRFLDADDPSGDFTVFQAREPKHEYSITHLDGHFYILTNWEAQNFRLMRCPVDAQGKAHWEEVIPHRQDVLLEGIELFRDYLVAEERQNGLNQLRVMHRSSPEEHYITFPDPAYVVQSAANYEVDTEVLRFQYASMNTPVSVYDYNMRTREATLLKQQEVVGGHDPKAYAVERLHATAEDGTQVPVSLVYRKDMRQEKRGPLLLYGYGSYGYSLDAGFSSVRLSLLDRGFAFAIAHIRGGEELGRMWYEQGKLLHKKNTFTDFIACAKHLIAEGYTSPDHLYAMGGSAGGLLMGAVINLEPELWKGVIAAVPFVDVVSTMIDDSIPLTTGEYDEWGNPHDPEYYAYIKSYSPYDNVKEQEYPHVLVTAGLHDSQVQYWEPAKWVAKLRTMRTGDNRLLLHTNMEAGHSGASGRYASLKETALEYAFLLDLEEIRE